MIDPLSHYTNDPLFANEVKRVQKYLGRITQDPHVVVDILTELLFKTIDGNGFNWPRSTIEHVNAELLARFADGVDDLGRKKQIDILPVLK